MQLKKIILNSEFIFNPADNNYYCDVSFNNATSVFVSSYENINVWSEIISGVKIRVYASSQPLSSVSLIINN